MATRLRDTATLLLMNGLCAVSAYYAWHRVVALATTAHYGDGNALANPLIVMQISVAILLGLIVATMVKGWQLRTGDDSIRFGAHIFGLTVFAALTVIWEFIISAPILAVSSTQQSVRVVIGISVAVNICVAVYYTYHTFRNSR